MFGTMEGRGAGTGSAHPPHLTACHMWFPWTMSWPKVACQALSELVISKKIHHCSVRQLKPGVEQLCEHPTLPVRCPW